MSRAAVVRELNALAELGVLNQTEHAIAVALATETEVSRMKQDGCDISEIVDILCDFARIGEHA